MRITTIGGVLAAGLALAACGPGEPAPPPAANVAVEAAPADPGRGALLMERAASIEARILQAVADKTMTPGQGQDAQAKLNTVRQTLSGMLALTQGPLPRDSRAVVAAALDAIEADVPQ